MKVIFLTGGAREGVLQSMIEGGIDVVAVVCPRPSKNNARFLPSILIAHEHGIPVITVDKTNIYEKLVNVDFDVLLSCGFSYVLEERVISLAKNIAVNIHPTLLPKYRGYRSGPYIVINGETKSGVTIHELTVEMDKGDIFLQEEFEVTLFDTTKSVFEKAKELEKEMILVFFRLLANGELKRSKQDERLATTYNAIRTPKDSLLDSSKSLDELYNFIRSCDPENYPAFFYVNGEKVCLKIWRPNNPEPNTI